MPGRPRRDTCDSRWLAQNFERGAVRACFVATAGFRVIRLRTRYRRDLTGERTREKQRAGKLLESAAIKLSGVLSGLHGVSGRDIMEHLIAGERDPKALARLARARAKIPRLEEALDGAGFFTGRHAALLEAMLRRTGFPDAGIDRVSAVIGELLAPWEEQLQQAGSMPGWQRRAAQDILAGTGPDMTRFATPGHLVSRAGCAPLDHQSGQRKGRGKRKKGNRYTGAVTGETSVSAGRARTREGSRYRRIARRRGKAKAQVALGSTQLKVCHKLLSNPGMRYEDPGEDYYDRQASIRRKTRYHLTELEDPGWDAGLRPRQGHEDSTQAA